MAGRIKNKLAALLESKLIEAGYSACVNPDDLISQPNGGSIIADWATWSGFVTVNGVRRSVCSWDTMASCSKGLMIVINNPKSAASIEVFAES